MSILEAPPIQEPAAAVPAGEVPAPPRSFAHGLNYYKLFWIFFIGCILGVIVEMLWCLVTQGKIESRQGVIYGPFNPVYGFGALVLTVGLHWLEKKRDLWIFLGSVALGSAAEYLCSWVQETVFGSLSWQYDSMPFNLQGRINLLYSIFWGILGLLWVKDGYPLMSRLVEKIPNRCGIILTWILTVFLLLDMAISGLAVARQAARHTGRPAANRFEVFLDSRYTDEFLQKIYPNMVLVNDGADPPVENAEI